MWMLTQGKLHRQELYVTHNQKFMHLENFDICTDKKLYLFLWMILDFAMPVHTSACLFWVGDIAVVMWSECAVYVCAISDATGLE